MVGDFAVNFHPPKTADIIHAIQRDWGTRTMWTFRGRTEYETKDFFTSDLESMIEKWVVGPFENSTALSHLTNGSAFACVREWLHAVQSESRGGYHQGARGQDHSAMPRVRPHHAPIDTGPVSFSTSHNYTEADLPHNSRGAEKCDYASPWYDYLGDQCTTFRRGGLRKLWVYGILQRASSWGSRCVGFTRSGGAPWLIRSGLRNQLVSLQRGSL